MIQLIVFFGVLYLVCMTFVAVAEHVGEIVTRCRK